MPTRRSYPGHPPFVEAAADALDEPDAATGAARQPALLALDRLAATLTAGHAGQARIDDPDGCDRVTAATVAQARAHRAELAVALAAADLILAEVGAGSEPEPEPEPDTPPDTPAAAEAPTLPAADEEKPMPEAQIRFDPAEPEPFDHAAPADAAPDTSPDDGADADPADGPPSRRRRRHRHGEDRA